MPKAKITQDESSSRTNAYFEMYQGGATIIDICRKYDKSRNTVVKYLKMHEDFDPPGHGYKVKGKYRKEGNVRKEKVEFIWFNCPDELIEKLDNCPGKNRTAKFNLALENYLKIPAAKRPKNTTKPKNLDKTFKAHMSEKLTKKLDRSKGDRTSKMIAAIEMYINSFI